MKMVPEPGDLFKDGDGTTWITQYPQPSDKEPMVLLVWMGPEGGLSAPINNWLAEQYTVPRHPEGDYLPIPARLVPEPFTLIVELNNPRSKA